MARTKQTARKSLFGAATKGILKPHRYRPGSTAPSIPTPPPVNTQQFSVRFDDQVSCEGRAVAESFLRCSKCTAIFTSCSALVRVKRTEVRVWKCEFCCNNNAVERNFVAPTTADMCYVVRQAESRGHAAEEPTVIFCIDISSSMDTVFGSKTRLAAVQEAVREELMRMQFQKEKAVVGLVTFGSEVSYRGGKLPQFTLVPQKLYGNFQSMVQYAEGVNEGVNEGGIKGVKRVIKGVNRVNKVNRVNEVPAFGVAAKGAWKEYKGVIQGLQTYGCTALGPALILSTVVGGRKAGSKVILCTDGQANVGIGAVAGGNQGVFYDRAAKLAKEKGVAVSVLSIKGDSCNLRQLGKLAMATGGALLKIDPTTLGTQFRKIVKEEILGSASKVKVIVNRVFELVVEAGNTTVLEQDVGNFSAETELTYQFRILDEREYAAKYKEKIVFQEQQPVPMQVQIDYVGRDGRRYLQVINDQRILTKNQKETFQCFNFGLFAASVLQRGSRAIKDKNYALAKEIIASFMFMTDNCLEKSEPKENVEKFMRRVKKLERVLKSRERKAVGSEKKKEVKRKSKKNKLVESMEVEASIIQSDSQEAVLCNEMRAHQAIQ